MVCPFIDKELKGCSDVLNMRNVEQAMLLCADNFTECETFLKNYRKLNFSFRDMLRRGKTALTRKNPAPK